MNKIKNVGEMARQLPEPTR